MNVARGRLPARRSRDIRFLTALTALVVTACGSVPTPAEIGTGFDLGGVLDELGDCTALSETFVAVVKEAAEDLDAVAGATGGRVPAGDLAEKVDMMAGTTYFEIAERLGCDAVTQRLETIDQLRNLSTDSAASDDLISEVIRQLESQAG